MTYSINTTRTHGVAWNGPICGTCAARYLGSHACSQADIVRRVNELLSLLDGDSRADKNPPHNPMQTCPPAARRMVAAACVAASTVAPG